MYNTVVCDLRATKDNRSGKNEARLSDAKPRGSGG